MLSREQMDDLMAEENDRGLRGGAWVVCCAVGSLGILAAIVVLALT